MVLYEERMKKNIQEKIGAQLSPERRRSEMGHVKSNDCASIRRVYMCPRASKYDRLLLQGMRGSYSILEQFELCKHLEIGDCQRYMIHINCSLLSSINVQAQKERLKTA